MKPTPEQVEAAKAWCKNQATPDMMRCVWATDNPKRSSPTEPSLLVARILLAALEAAEADSARLDWLEAHKETSYNPPALSRVALGWPLGTSLRDAIDAARKAQP